MMAGATRRDLSVDVFGMSLHSPLMMAPVGVIGLCAQDGHGDLATARAAARTGVPTVASTFSVDPLERVADEFGGTPGFFSLYTPTDRALAESLVHRAEAAGFKGIVVTLDTWITGWRPRDLGASNFPQLRGHCLANYTSDPLFRARLAKPPEEDMQAAVLEWARIFGNPLTWDDLPWLRSVTDLPLVLKGICHPETCAGPGTAAWTGSTAPITADARRTAALPPWTRCRKWSRRRTACRSCSTRASAAVRRCQGPGAGRHRRGRGPPVRIRPGPEGTNGIIHVLRSLLAEADLIMAVDGYPTLKDLRVDGAIRRNASTPGRPPLGRGPRTHRRPASRRSLMRQVSVSAKLAGSSRPRRRRRAATPEDHPDMPTGLTLKVVRGRFHPGRRQSRTGQVHRSRPRAAPGGRRAGAPPRS